MIAKVLKKKQQVNSNGKEVPNVCLSTEQERKKNWHLNRGVTIQ